MNYDNKIVDGGFLQSDHWKKFQKAIGRKVVEVKSEEADALMVLHELPIVGEYFFVPRGPLMKISNFKFQISNKNQNTNLNIQKPFQDLIEKAKEYNAGWIRVEPQSNEGLEAIQKFLGDKYEIVKSGKNHEPAQTLMLDLQKSEEELLAQMKQKTRYNIRLAFKKGIVVEKKRDKRSIHNFLEMNKETARRDGIVTHPDLYYEKMIAEIPEENLKLYLASYEGEAIAAGLVSFFGGVATYLHGASSNKYRNVMAPFVLQWQAIRDAKIAGYERYDFGGTKLVEKNGKWHPEDGSWKGISKFKLGFCPDCQPIQFPGCWDVVIKKRRYLLYRFLQITKKFI